MHTTIKIQTSMMECILLRNARVLHWEVNLTRKYATGICMWSFVLPINPSGPFFFIVWWGKEKLKKKEILIIVKLPPKSWKKEFRRILCRQVRGLALSKNNFSCMPGLCYASLFGSPAFLILNTVYFKHTQQASNKCALALLLNEVLKISLERDIVVQGPNWETCATHSHPQSTQVNSPPPPLPGIKLRLGNP